MNWNSHFELRNSHAFLSPSKHSWVNYDPSKLETAYAKYLAVERGTKLHALAHDLIKLGVKLPKLKKAFNMYVNDAIGFSMTPEQPLAYSVNAFGTADAICFREGLLRIHDLKTGASRTYMEQLMIYTALFCLEYEEKPNSIKVELRIYQDPSVVVHIPEPDEIETIMRKIVHFDKILEKLKSE